MNRDRKSRLSAADRDAERIRANELRNARNAAWSDEKRAEVNAYTRAWRETHRQQHRDVTQAWYEANAERARAKKAQEYRENPEAFLARNLVRKARLREAICEHGAGCVAAAFLAEVYAADCSYCGAPAEHADHFEPLARGGLHCRENIVPACSACNAQKSWRDPIEWLESLAG